MAKYKYDKYSLKDSYYLGSSYGSGTVVNAIMSGYTSFKLNQTTGLVEMGSTWMDMQTNQSAGRSLYNFTTGGKTLITRYFNPNNPGQFLKSSRDVLTGSKVKNAYIETVTAEDGTYPNDGISGSYWYIKQGLVESATLTLPNGGETLNEGFNITWTLSSAGLKTKIELSADNGATWKTLLTTDVDITSYNYNFVNEAESSTCRIRVTPTDGTNFGTSDVSNGVFTIQHNQAPIAPTNLSPANGIIVDRTEIQRLTWKHNDTDAQSKFDLQWSSDGGQNWTTITKTTVNQYLDIAVNTFPAGTITWRVRTYDQEDLVSPYSNQVTFTSSEPSDAPIITSADTWNIARPTIQWSSVGQAKYQVQVLDSINTVVWDSGQITSGNKAVTVGADLVNSSTYTVKVRIADSGGIWSSYATQSISISFTPPEIPLVTVSTNEARASITLEIVNPEGLTAVTHNDIYRDGQRIGTGIIGGFTDYTVESEKEYSYRARAVGENGTYADSEVVTSSVPVKHTQLVLTTNYNKWIELKWNPEKSDNRQHNSVSNYFAGRRFAVTDFSENENNNIPNSFAIRDKAELDKLIEIYDAKETVLYRDRRGKRLFGTLNNLSIADESPRTWWTVSFTVNQVDFNEVI